MPIKYSGKEKVKKPKKSASILGVSDNLKIENETDSILLELARQTEGYVGADIEAVCREAAILALRENIKATTLNEKHFAMALDTVKPSVTKDIEKAYSELQDHFKQARAQQMQDEKPSYMG
jgi:transitional endoplasmic reticulum ATPase